MNGAFFGDLLQTISDRGRKLLSRRTNAVTRSADFVVLCEDLLSGPGRSLRGRAGAGNPQPLFGADHRSPHRVLRSPGAAIRSRSGADGKGDRGLAGQSERRHRRRGPSGRRAAPAGIVAQAQSRAGRNRCAGADARAIARRHGAPQRPCGGGCRFRPSVLVVVQSRLSGAARHRLVDAGQHPREDHQARGGAQDPELGRSAPPDRSG